MPSAPTSRRLHMVSVQLAGFIKKTGVVIRILYSYDERLCSLCRDKVIWGM